MEEKYFNFLKTEQGRKWKDSWINMKMKFKNGSSIESIPCDETKRSIRGRILIDKESKVMQELEIIMVEKRIDDFMEYLEL